MTLEQPELSSDPSNWSGRERGATIVVVGDGFLASDITLENTDQAVALGVGSDLSAFYDYDMIAFQDNPLRPLSPLVLRPLPRRLHL